MDESAGGTDRLFRASALHGPIPVLEAAAVEISHKVTWAKLEYFGILSVGPLWLLFALAYARQIAVPLRALLLLWTLPAAGLVLVFTNEHHHLIWTSIARSAGQPAVLIYGHGAGFWALVGYTYVLLAAGAVVMVMAIARFPAPFKSQAAALLLAKKLMSRWSRRRSFRCIA